MTGQSIERRTATEVARDEDARAWENLERRAGVLSRTKLVPRECQGSPDTTMAALLTLDAYGLQPNVINVNQLHFIEGRPEPSAQMLAGLLGRNGYEIDWIELTPTVASGRLRRVARIPGQPDGAWSTPITWTIEQARVAGMLDVWVERRTEDGNWPDGNKKWKIEKFVLDRAGVDEPGWVTKQRTDGNVKRQENWHRYPDDMLASKVVRRLVKRFAAHITLGVDEDELAPVHSPGAIRSTGPEVSAGPGAPGGDIIDVEEVGDDPQAEDNPGENHTHVTLVDPDWIRRFAIRIREHATELGVNADDLRHAIIWTGTNGRIQSVKELRQDEAPHVTAWTAMLLDGHARLVDRDGPGYRLVEHDPAAQP